MHTKRQENVQELNVMHKNVHNKNESQLQRPKWSLISAKYCDIMWALLLLEIEINLYFVTAEMSQHSRQRK